MEVSRTQLTEQFRTFTDEELLRHLQSEDLTSLATEVASAELRSRGIEPRPARAEAIAYQGAAAEGAQADLVTVSETWDQLQANVLRGRLESEGIAVYVWSDPAGTPDARGGRARVQVERYQVEQAASVIAAIERGDLEIPDSPDTTISTEDPVRFARRTARGGALPFAILAIRWFAGSFMAIRAAISAGGNAYAVTGNLAMLIQALVASALLMLAWRTYRKPTVLLCSIATVLAGWDFVGAFIAHRLSGFHLLEVVSALTGLYAAWVVKTFQRADRPPQSAKATS